MRIYLVHIQYQGDDREEDEYLVYSNETDEDKVQDMVIDLPIYPTLAEACIANWAEEEDEEDDMYEECYVEDITEETIEENWEDDSWFKSLEVIIDER